MVDVELVHLDDCPHWREAEERVREAMRRCGLDPAGLVRGEVTAAAALADFPGSPTVLLDGRDPFAAREPAGDTCLLYLTSAGVEGAPSVEQLVEALHR